MGREHLSMITILRDQGGITKQTNDIMKGIGDVWPTVMPHMMIKSGAENFC